MEELIFDSLEPAEVPAMRVGSKQYVLREASEAAAARYENYHITRTKYTEDGKLAGLGDVADGKAVLVALCLWELRELNGSLQRFPVSEQTVRAWPSRVVAPLFEQAKRMSGLDRDTEEAIEKRIVQDTKRLAELRAKKGKEDSEAKNSPEGGTPTSDSPTS